MIDVLEYQIALGSALRTFRKEQELSQEKLAYLCSCHQHFISEIECGKRNITVSTLILFANELNIKLGNLFTLADTYMIEDVICTEL